MAAWLASSSVLAMAVAHSCPSGSASEIDRKSLSSVAVEEGALQGRRSDLSYSSPDSHAYLRRRRRRRVEDPASLGAEPAGGEPLKGVDDPPQLDQVEPATPVLVFVHKRLAFAEPLGEFGLEEAGFVPQSAQDLAQSASGCRMGGVCS